MHTADSSFPGSERGVRGGGEERWEREKATKKKERVRIRRMPSEQTRASGASVTQLLRVMLAFQVVWAVESMTLCIAEGFNALALVLLAFLGWHFIPFWYWGSSLKSEIFCTIVVHVVEAGLFTLLVFEKHYPPSNPVIVSSVLVVFSFAYWICCSIGRPIIAMGEAWPAVLRRQQPEEI